MLTNQSVTRILKLFFSALLILSLNACDQLQGLMGSGGGDEEASAEQMGDAPEIKFGAARYVPWLPWYLAQQDEIFAQYNMEYNVNITFVQGSYEGLLNQFIAHELDAIALTNIDLFAQMIRRKIEVDIILISSYSDGNDAILIPAGGTKTLEGKRVAFKEFSSAHYLLDRYLLKNQLSQDDIQIEPRDDEEELEAAFVEGEADAIATWNPLADKLQREQNAQLLFSSRAIPKEIYHVVAVHRDVLAQHPNVGNALLGTWFNLMGKLKGNSKGATMDALMALAGIENRGAFNIQFESLRFAADHVKALSVLRDRSVRKGMRLVRFFMEQPGRELGGEVSFREWVSYPGRKPELVHFNDKPLKMFTSSGAEAQF